MPAVTIVLPKSMPPARRKSVSDGVHLALVEEYGTPKNGKFHTITPYDSDSVLMDERFLGVPRSADFTFVQIFVMEGHSDEKTRSLIRKIRANLRAEASLKPEDLLINVVASPKQNWFCMVT